MNGPLDREGALHAGGVAAALEEFLQRQGVQDRREHAHVVGSGDVDAELL